MPHDVTTGGHFKLNPVSGGVDCEIFGLLAAEFGVPVKGWRIRAGGS
jgi:hypothetical protein